MTNATTPTQSTPTPASPDVAAARAPRTVEAFDSISELAREIKRLANPDTLGLDDIRQIWQRAHAIETARREQLQAEMADDFTPSLGAYDDDDFCPETEIGAEEVSEEFEDYVATGRY